MPPQDTARYFEWLNARLTNKGYAGIGGMAPIDRAYFKLGALNLPYVIAIIDTAHVSNTPSEIFKRIENWLSQLHGATGAACILFLYHGTPPDAALKEIQGIGGYVTAGAHDLRTGEHWLSNHLNWEQEIYGN